MAVGKSAATTDGKAAKSFNKASGFNADMSPPAGPKVTNTEGTPAALAVLRSVSLSPTKIHDLGSPPNKRAASNNGAGSGLRTGSVSAPTRLPKTCRPG